MKKKFSIAISMTAILTIALTSLALAAHEPASDVEFIAAGLPALCQVNVRFFSYIDPITHQSGSIPGGTTPDQNGDPYTLSTAPSSSVTFLYDVIANCPDGNSYNLVSISPSNPVVSGAVGAPPVTVTGHYAVPDTTAPTLHLPANMSVEATAPTGATVNFLATADDTNPAHPAVTCNPSSGSTFPLDSTTVSCSATDAANNTANGSFTVTVVDTTVPTITDNADMTVEGNTTGGANVTYTDPTATDIGDANPSVSCLPATGSFFALGGPTAVTCTATDDSSNSTSSSFDITVVDNIAPTLVGMPADMTVESNTTGGANVAYTDPTATDIVDASPFVSCTPASGSFFALGGPHTVTCTAIDDSLNSSSASFNVTVTEVVDTTPPILELPGDMTVPALNASGAVVNFTASANDQIDGPVDVICSPISGSLFPLGATTVSCSATDSHGNSASESFTVTIVDTTPPTLTLPSSMIVPALNASGAWVNFTASANDLVDGPVPVTCSPGSGLMFPIGTTAVNCSATDSHGNNARGNFIVAVQYAIGNCNGVPGHQILQPINADDSSVFKAGSTVPAKFRVCGTDGASIGTPGVVTNFRLIKIISNGTEMIVDEPVDSTTPDTNFRSGNGQWIFNINTKNLVADNAYVYRIALNDGSFITFRFDLK